MSSPTSWHSAVDSCENMSSQLVIIESQSEREFVHNLATSSYWIGLTDTQTEGTFLWINGQAPTDTSWSLGEPNDDKLFGEDCVEVLLPPKEMRSTTSMIVDGKWNDESCERRKSFVCKKSKDRFSLRMCQIMSSNCVVTVAAKMCPWLSSLRHGNVDINDVIVDSLANYTCSDGYSLIGESS